VFGRLNRVFHCLGWWVDANITPCLDAFNNGAARTGGRFGRPVPVISLPWPAATLRANR
jgi:hypothetical protein